MIPCRCRRLGLSDSDSPHVGPVKYRFSCDYNTDRHDDEPLPALNPWKRHRGCPTPSSHNMPGFRSPPVINSSRSRFNCYSVNTGLDAYTKRAVLKVSPSVVALLSYSAGREFFSGSGVIFGSFWKNDSLYYSVLTSATLLRPPPSHRLDMSIKFRSDPAHPLDYDCLPIDEKVRNIQLLPTDSHILIWSKQSI
jgi:hypothetical protein